jgi:hypothetical protein
VQRTIRVNAGSDFHCRRYVFYCTTCVVVVWSARVVVVFNACCTCDRCDFPGAVCLCDEYDADCDCDETPC